MEQREKERSLERKKGAKMAKQHVPMNQIVPRLEVSKILKRSMKKRQGSKYKKLKSNLYENPPVESEEMKIL